MLDFVGYKALRERYTSRVELEPCVRIDVTQTDGPFRRLENHWRFAARGQECRIDFFIAFEFRSRLLGRVAGAALGLVMSQMTDAFETRALPTISTFPPPALPEFPSSLASISTAISSPSL